MRLGEVRDRTFDLGMSATKMAGSGDEARTCRIQEDPMMDFESAQDRVSASPMLTATYLRVSQPLGMFNMTMEEAKAVAEWQMHQDVTRI